MNRALFLDRDGVINERIIDGYVRTSGEFVLLDDVLPILALAKERGYLLVLITNQQGVGKGLMSHEDLAMVHAHMQELLERRLGFALDAIYLCTDLASSGSVRRKPQPGMLLEAMAHHQVSAADSWFLGDSRSDAEAGRAAGVHTALVGDFASSEADIVAPTLREILIPLSAVV